MSPFASGSKQIRCPILCPVAAGLSGQPVVWSCWIWSQLVWKQRCPWALPALGWRRFASKGCPTLLLTVCFLVFLLDCFFQHLFPLFSFLFLSLCSPQHPKASAQSTDFFMPRYKDDDLIFGDMERGFLAIYTVDRASNAHPSHATGFSRFHWLLAWLVCSGLCCAVLVGVLYWGCGPRNSRRFELNDTKIPVTLALLTYQQTFLTRALSIQIWWNPLMHHETLRAEDLLGVSLPLRGRRYEDVWSPGRSFKQLGKQH